jgi:hypothetical protein
MKAILKKVGEDAKIIDADLSYDFMVKTVGGFIQMVPTAPCIDIVCNEEGMFAGPNGTPLPANDAGYLGDVLMLATGEDGEHRDMTAEELRKGLAYFQAGKGVLHGYLMGEEPLTGLIMGKENIEAFLKAKNDDILALWDGL